MKNKSSNILRLGIIGFTVGSLCVAGAAIAQTDAAKKTDTGTTAATAEAAATKENSLSERDRTFLKKAAKGGMMEVELGQMAQDHAKSDDVKSFGKRMVTDHSKANEELKSLAQKKGWKLPNKKPIKEWTSDKDYMEAMVKDHEKDLAEFQTEAKEGSDPDLKEFAERTAKIIEEHLTLARETKSKVE